MSDLDALLAGVVADPHEETRWLVLADWLDEHDDPRRAELLRLHRRLLATCRDPDAHPARAGWHARIMELMRAGAKPCLPQRTRTLPGGVELVGAFIPPGSFRMGSPESEVGREDDEAAHVVTLTRGFFAGVHQVTQAQWFSVMGTNPSRYLTDGSEWDVPVNELWRRTQSQRLPVETVSWDAAVDFCQTLSALTDCTVRLPTEAEWEYACRAGTSTAYYWGDQSTSLEAWCNWERSETQRRNWDGSTCEVGAFAARCPHPWGLTDLHGNVWEWCADVPDSGSPTSAEECRYIARGGSWADTPGYCRAAYRYLRRADGSDDIGFRVVFWPD